VRALTPLQAFLAGPARSFIVSQAFALWSIVVTVATVGWGLGPSNGGYNDWPTFCTFFRHAWFGIFLGLVFGIGPYYRARQGATAVGSGTPMLTPPPNGPSPTPPKLVP
jgi:hypothetical protein